MGMISFGSKKTKDKFGIVASFKMLLLSWTLITINEFWNIWGGEQTEGAKIQTIKSKVRGLICEFSQTQISHWRLIPSVVVVPLTSQMHTGNGKDTMPSTHLDDRTTIRPDVCCEVALTSQGFFFLSLFEEMTYYHLFKLHDNQRCKPGPCIFKKRTEASWRLYGKSPP